MSLYEFDKLPATSGAAITEFLDRYIAAQGVVPPPSWVDDMGDTAPINAPKATFPISQVSGGYVESNGENRFKTMPEASFDVKVLEFDMGYEARLLDLFQNVYAVRKWNEAPMRFNVAEQKHRAKSIATLLEAGENTNCTWEDTTGTIKFFDTAHPANFADAGAGTFSNYNAAGLDPNSIANIMSEMASMALVLDENGEKLGVEADTILLPTQKYFLVSALLQQAQVSATSGTGQPNTGITTMSNPLLGKLRAVHVPELTDANDWYLVDSKLVRALPPWAALRYAAPDSLGLRTWDESSDFFKDTGRIKVSSHIWYGFALVFPHAIRKVVGA
jgi:hypothetical protein